MDLLDQRITDHDKQLEQHFNERIEGMDQHFERLDQCFNEIIDRKDKCLMEQDPKSVEMREDRPRDRQSKALPGLQALPEGEDVHSEESCELKDNSTADGEKSFPV